MSTGVIVILAVAAVIILALVLARPMMRGKGSLQHRFGPEYQVTVERHGGDAKAAERELQQRLRRHGDLRLRPLPAEVRERYVGEWALVQERFVDSPAQAVSEAEALLGRLAHERGYPAAEAYEEQIEALSVHQPEQIGGYRQVHTVAGRARDGRAGTEELREALVRARGLFEELVKAHRADTGDHRTREKPRRKPSGKGLTDRMHLPRAAGHRQAGPTKGGA